VCKVTFLRKVAPALMEVLLILKTKKIILVDSSLKFIPS